ncbi:MAG: ABC transporter ATP-binding protein, partial [Anaerolineae bacterium]|nr:ABC transporter ATP-binding protein [Anaerolineae bacterium]
TSLLVLDGKGHVREFVGGYDDWQRQVQLEKTNISENLISKKATGLQADEKPASRRLTYKEQKALEARQKELSELPARIETLEKEQQLLSEKMAENLNNEELNQTAFRLKELEDELTTAFERWQALEEIEN